MSARREKRRAPNGTEKWYWIVDFVFRHPDGRSQRFRKYSPVNNRRGAEEYERKLRDELLHKRQSVSGEATLDERAAVPTFSEFAADFCSKYVATNNKVSEAHAKRILLDLHLKPAFGAMRLDKITAKDIEVYKSQKLGSGYVAKSVNNHLAVLRKMLKIAVEWDEIATLPMVKPLKTMTPIVRFLSFDEAEALSNAAEPAWKTMVVLALNTGLRLGELLALRWRHVDLNAGHIVVCESDWRGIVMTPKNHRSRVVPLNSIALKVLTDHRHSRGPRVFCKIDGSPLKYYLCKHPLRRACRKAGFVEPVQWHALRHTFASHLAMRAVPLRTIQELLGHATLDMTLRYAHLMPDATKAAVAALVVSSGAEDTESAATHGTLIAHELRAKKKDT